VRQLQRRLELIVLAHLWVLAPLSLAWFLVPRWRTSAHSSDAVRDLAALTVIAAGYVAVRSWVALRRSASPLPVWPYVDVLLITAALDVLHSPTDAMAFLYLLPLASTAATGSLLNLGTLAALATAGLAFVMVRSNVAWGIEIIYRVIIIGVVASVYGAMMRLVAAHERVAERQTYQRELSREIHDGVQYLLAVISARLELARRLIFEDPDRAAAMIEGEATTVRRAGDELRYLVRRLRTDTYQVDLGTALRQQVSALADRWAFDVDVVIPDHLPRLSPASEHAVLRVIQESLTNVAKHAEASRVTVAVNVDGPHLHCTVQDDGIGFRQEPDSAAPPLTDSDAAVNGGHGLENLRERVAAAAGTLNVRSSPGQGTTISASFRIPDRTPWKPFAS
jgi:signal transduction histidine kinase